MNNIFNELRRAIYRIPPQTYGFLIMGLALWFIATSALDLASILPEIISGEEVSFPPFFGY